MDSKFRHHLWNLRFRLQIIRLKSIELISRPFLFVKTLYEQHQLKVQYPDRWERYCEQKRRENRKKRAADLAIAHCKLLGSICSIEIGLIAYCDLSEKNDQERLNYLQAHFIVDKRAALEAINELENLEVALSPELKTLISAVTVDYCHNLDECQEFSDKVNALMPNNIFDDGPA